MRRRQRSPMDAGAALQPDPVDRHAALRTGRPRLRAHGRQPQPCLGSTRASWPTAAGSRTAIGGAGGYRWRSRPRAVAGPGEADRQVLSESPGAPSRILGPFQHCPPRPCAWGRGLRPGVAALLLEPSARSQAGRRPGTSPSATCSRCGPPGAGRPAGASAEDAQSCRLSSHTVSPSRSMTA